MAVMTMDGARCTVHGGSGAGAVPVRFGRCPVHLLIGLALLAPHTAAAQESAPRPTIVTVSQYAKWPALAAAVGFTTGALLRSRDADRVYEALTAFCIQTQDACRVMDVSGTRRYRGDDAERLYQETIRLDHRARGWLIAGQVSLLAAGAMFVVDLVTGNDGPENIPFTGMSVITNGRQLGLRVAF